MKKCGLPTANAENRDADKDLKRNDSIVGLGEPTTYGLIAPTRSPPTYHTLRPRFRPYLPPQHRTTLPVWVTPGYRRFWDFGPEMAV